MTICYENELIIENSLYVYLTLRIQGNHQKYILI